MKQSFLKYLKILVPITIIMVLAHYFIQTNAFPEATFFYSLWSIYTFHFVLALVTFLAVVYVQFTLPEKTGLGYLALTGIKMFAALIFLIPLLQSSIENPIPTVFSFFIPYFIYLAVEVVFVVKLLN
ncbi:hypothetical protein [Joostella sp. CR20]|uniref:hypothetical protein n=1 Tax=Joostella sp. CR20 TaxID=2804312 RepID=UPI00313D215A